MGHLQIMILPTFAKEQFTSYVLQLTIEVKIDTDIHFILSDANTNVLTLISGQTVCTCTHNVHVGQLIPRGTQSDLS